MQADKILFGTIMVLFTLSLILSYSLSEYAVRYYHGYSELHFFSRQFGAILLGITLMIWLSRLDPDRWCVRIGFGVFLLSSLAMVAMPFMPESLVSSVLGAKRWIHLGPISLSPVEYFKVGFVFFLGWSFSRKMLVNTRLSLLEEAQMIFPYLMVFAVAVLLIAVLQKDLGQVAILAMTLMVLFMFAGRSVKLFASMLFAGVLLVVALI